MFTLAVSWLATSNLLWFVDLTFQVPMQCCSLQHQTWLPPPDTSTTEHCFCSGIRNTEIEDSEKEFRIRGRKVMCLLEEWGLFIFSYWIRLGSTWGKAAGSLEKATNCFQAREQGVEYLDPWGVFGLRGKLTILEGESWCWPQWNSAPS